MSNPSVVRVESISNLSSVKPAAFNNPLSIPESEHALSIKLCISEDDLKKSQFENIKTDESLISSNIKYYITVNYNQENDEATFNLFFFPSISNIEIKLTSFIESAGYKHSFSSPNNQFPIGNCCYVAKLEHVFDVEKKFFVDKTLTLLIDGKVKILGYSPSLGPTLKFSDAGSILWKDNESKDAVILVIEQPNSTSAAKKIQIHSCVLQAHSPVLKQKLTASNNEIMIEGFNEDTVLTAIQYCYGMDVYIPFTNLPLVMKLLEFAEEFKIVRLKEEIEQKLVEKIQESNVCKLYACSIKANAIQLNNKCKEFIVKCMKEEKQVADMNVLDKESKAQLFEAAISYQNLPFRTALTAMKKSP